jgi:hypothetical protein
MGWTAIENGELLMLASERFDVFVTVDRNLSFQQNLVSFSIAVVALQAKSNRLADLRPLISEVLAAIEFGRPGTVKFVGPNEPGCQGQSRMKKGSTTSFRLNPKKVPKSDWRTFDAMSDEERHRASLSDPDCPPATEAQLARAASRPSAPCARS